jgi:hypothetical protein
MELEFSMIRTLVLTALASAGFALPAMAQSPASAETATDSAFSAVLDDAATGEQARQMLAHEGYTHVSALDHYQPGRWIGTAEKNGKPVTVSVIWPYAPKHAAAID